MQTSRDEITHRARHRKHTDDGREDDETWRGEANEGAPNEARRRVYHNPLRIIRILIEQVVCPRVSLIDQRR